MPSFNFAWEKQHQQKNWGKYPPEDLIRFIANNYFYLNKAKRAKIKMVDFGCGQGACTWFLAKEGFDVIGVDGSKAAIEKAKAYLKSESLKAKLITADFIKFQLPEETIDCLIDIESIYAHKIAHIKKIYQNIYSFLKKNGRFFSMCFSAECSNFGLGEEIEKNTFKNIPEGAPSTSIVHYFNKQELIKWLSEAGFKEIEINHKQVSRNNEQYLVKQWIVECKK